MTPIQAIALLGLPDGPLTADAVRSAFVNQVKETHPDTLNGAGKPDLARLKMARDMLMNEIATQNNACALCCGTGKVRGRIGMQGCSACEGTGERK